MREYTREQFLALTPARYLAEGWRDGSGQPRRELRGDYATAACTQLLAAELPPQELAFTYEALKQVLPLHDGAPAGRLRAALSEALDTVARMIRQPNNGGFVRWIEECAAAVGSAADLDAFMDHVAAVVRQYGLLATLPQPESSSSAPA